jgi:hypothetical protein
MRIGVIRDDLSAPILAADLEQVSRRNDSVDAPGQVRYLSYPTDAALQQAMDDNGATGITVAVLRAAVYPTPTTFDVSEATISALGWVANPDPAATAAAIADVVAPQFAETDVAIESFLVGNISGFRSASFNPDPRNPAVSAGAAVYVTEDDGTTDFATANTVPTVTSADYNSPAANDLTVVGTGLGKESGDATDPLRSTVLNLSGAGVNVSVSQEAIEAAGGTVTDTEIFIPAGSGIIPASTAGLTAVVKFRQLVSAGVAVGT